jgi:hypothetical protein
VTERRMTKSSGVDYTRATFLCPLCGSRVSSSKVQPHVAKWHPNTTEEEMRVAILGGLRAGSMRVELSGKSFRATSGTDLIARERMTNKLGVVRMVQGGAPGLKKTRT